MLKEKIKSLTQKKVGKDNKKTVENLVVFLILFNHMDQIPIRGMEKDQLLVIMCGKHITGTAQIGSYSITLLRQTVQQTIIRRRERALIWKATSLREYLD